MLAKSLQSCPTPCDPMNCNQAPLSVGFFRQEYWRGLPCSPPGDLPNQGFNPCLQQWQVGSLLLVPPGKPKYWVDGHNVKEGAYIVGE